MQQGYKNNRKFGIFGRDNDLGKGVIEGRGWFEFLKMVCLRNLNSFREYLFSVACWVKLTPKEMTMYGSRSVTFDNVKGPARF